MWFMRRAKPVSTNQRDVKDDEPDEADEHQEVKGMGRLPTPEEPWCRRENGSPARATSPCRTTAPDRIE